MFFNSPPSSCAFCARTFPGESKQRWWHRSQPRPSGGADGKLNFFKEKKERKKERKTAPEGTNYLDSPQRSQIVDCEKWKWSTPPAATAAACVSRCTFPNWQSCVKEVFGSFFSLFFFFLRIVGVRPSHVLLSYCVRHSVAAGTHLAFRLWFQSLCYCITHTILPRGNTFSVKKPRAKLKILLKVMSLTSRSLFERLISMCVQLLKDQLSSLLYRITHTQNHCF